MTDKEIIQSFEHYNWYDDKDITVTCVKSVLLKNAYFLMCRQQAEIERLKEKDLTETKRFMMLAENYIQAEAIKEFADKLKRKKSTITAQGLVGRKEMKVVEISDIDNLVKEMEITKNE